MKRIKRAAAKGWAIKIWPGYDGYTVGAVKAGDVERIGHGKTVKAAVKDAFRGCPV